MKQKTNTRLRRLLDREVEHLKGCDYEVLQSYPASSTVVRLRGLTLTILRTSGGDGQDVRIVVLLSVTRFLGFKTMLSDGFVKHPDGTSGPFDRDGEVAAP